MFKILIRSFSQYRGLPREVYIIAFQRFVTSLGGFVYPFLMLFLNVKIGLELDRVGELMLISALVGLPGSLIAGHYIDRMNRKMILIVSRVLAAILFIVCGLLEPTIVIFYIVVAANFVSSFSHPASGAMMSDITRPENRKQSFSLLYLCMNVGLAVSFTFAGYLFENFWRLLFIGDGITSIISLIPLILFVKETRPTEKEIDEINQDDEREGEKSVGGNVLVALGRRPFLLAFVLINTALGFVYSQHGFLLPAYLEELFSNGAVLFGGIMQLNTILVIVFTPILVEITKRFSPIVNVMIASTTYIIGFGMMGLITGKAMFFVATIIWTAGEIFATVNTGVYIANHSPVNQRGRFNSIIGLIHFSGRATAPFFMGIFAVAYGSRFGWFLTAGVALVALIALYILNVTEKNKSLNETTFESEVA